jgi:hypothetical protein
MMNCENGARLDSPRPLELRVTGLDRAMFHVKHFRQTRPGALALRRTDVRLTWPVSIHRRDCAPPRRADARARDGLHPQTGSRRERGSCLGGDIRLASVEGLSLAGPAPGEIHGKRDQ